MKKYQEFLRGKQVVSQQHGFDVPLDKLNPLLKPFQAAITQWAIKTGCASLFEDTGLGKTFQHLEWSKFVAEHTNGKVLVLCPLAVVGQEIREGDKFGIKATAVETQSDCVGQGIFVTNYHKLQHFDCESFDGVVLVEASILKNFSGKTKQMLCERFAKTPFKLTETATPAPNDHMEIGNQSEFLGIMPSNEMLARWFINDSMEFGSYRLKRHAEKDFWRWVSSWAVCLQKPSDLGYDDEGYILPPLNIIEEIVDVDVTANVDGKLYRDDALTATSIHREMRLTAKARADRVASIVNGSDETWLIWCNTDYEADELMDKVKGCVEVRGSMPEKRKVKGIEGFMLGEIPRLLTKPKIAGYGLNFQYYCHNMCFVGLSYSFEDYLQALRRVWRYGQKFPVNCHVICATTEGQVVATIKRKQKQHTDMMGNMSKAAAETSLLNLNRRKLMKVENDIAAGKNWKLLLGDCVEETKKLESDSVGFSIFSPPFQGLYIYSDSVADMGNSDGDEEFYKHFGYLIPELYRVTISGRLCAVHCKDLPLYKGRDEEAGLKDFPGDLVRLFISHGWTFHSRVTIWKDPVIEMQRTKNNGLLHKTLCRDSSQSRQGMADYLLVFRKFPKDGTMMSAEPVQKNHSRDNCFDRYVGSQEPVRMSNICKGGIPDMDATYADISGNPIPANFGLEVWQRYASPVWFDIDQTDVLNYRIARTGSDEKHICPLQLGVVERAVHLWTNKGDVVFSPFCGIGSEGYISVKDGRKFVGVELKRAYWEIATDNLKRAEEKLGERDLYDMSGVEVAS